MKKIIEVLRKLKLGRNLPNYLGIVGIIFGVYSIQQTNQTIKIANETFEASLPQRVSDIFSDAFEEDRTICIKNLNKSTIINVKVYFVQYIYNPDEKRLIYREKSKPLIDLASLSPKLQRCVKQDVAAV